MIKTITYADFQTDEATDTRKAIDYYEGNQLDYVQDMLDGKGNGYGKYEDWRNRGLIPYVRNITKSIVDKSGLLFNKPPVLGIIPPGSKKMITDETFVTIMNEADYLEFFHNVDVYTRLVKSTVVLQQKYIPSERNTVSGEYRFDPVQGDALLLILLHRGNSAVKMDITNTKVVELGYLIDVQNNPADTDEDDAGDVWYYRYINGEVIQDYRVKGDKEEPFGPATPNLDGIVAASMFYDINKPRNGAWVDSPEDIVSMQEAYNLYLTHVRFAAKWQMEKTLFTDSPIVDSQQLSQNIQGIAAPVGKTPPGTMYGQNQTKKTLGGLGRIVSLMPGQNDKPPFVKFDGPNTDLNIIDEMIRNQVRDVAFDWDVNINLGNEVRASSGFQLIVEDLHNLQLREKRAQAFRAGLRRFYNITKRLYTELTEGTLWADFAPPSIPINTLEQEQLWQMRLDGNRSSLKDYFMETQEMKDQEAEDKIAEIIAEKNMLAKELPDTTPDKLTPAGDAKVATLTKQGNSSPSSTTG